MSNCCARKVVTARKAHRCQECGVRIEPGTGYVVQSGIYDNAPYRFALCAPCDALSTWAGSKDGPLHGLEPEDHQHNLLTTLLVAEALVGDWLSGSVRVAPEWAHALDMDPARQYPVLKVQEGQG